MASLLEVVIAFVAVMLVLALAAQSLQEVIKIMVAVKSQTAVRALRGLVLEAAKASKLLESDGEAIFRTVVERLQGLGQNGVRKSALRLDMMTPEKLASLIETSTPVAKSSLEATADTKSDDRLKDVAKKVIDWFPLAWDPVDDRYRRRMRGYAILSAAIVVIGFNADALAVLQQAREDPAYRAAAIGTATHLDSLSQRANRLSDTTQAGGDTTAAGRKARADSLTVVRDSIAKGILAVKAGETGFVLGARGGQRWGDIMWWIGIVLSTLLVSLGAPFWHDLLESLFGLKNRIQAQAKAASVIAAVKDKIG